MIKKPVMVITGTSKGIGEKIADYYLNQGFFVIGCSRGDHKFNSKYYEHYFLDICNEVLVKKMFKQIRKKFGRMDILINNAGIASHNHTLLTPLEKVQETMNINFIGTFLFCRESVKIMKINQFGTEPMPESTLLKLNSLFPNIKFLQTYGLIELGVLRSKSKKNDSLWVQVGGKGYETRIVGGMLEIKAKSAMLGYLNAATPFTKDGWFKTGDAVEVDGDYIKILGRKSELINVGGEKVYPQEVESVIQEIENVAEVRVYKEKNSIIGNIVCA